MGKNKINKFKFVPLIILILGLLALLSVFLIRTDLAVLTPKGTIAAEQRDLINFATILSFFVVIPVFILTFYIAWKYRAGNTSAKYSPDWDGNKKLEFTWWAIPCAIILVLAVITWTSTHQLDPFKPLESSKKPVTIQVVALQWKWLFIYPEQNVASVNFFQIPEDTPINFEITSDAPMNSFWIPQLGGQVYAMSGMKTQLHLMADEPGDYGGSSANLSGDGFAGMRFVAKASSEKEFQDWVNTTKKANKRLSKEEYVALAAPSRDNQPAQYSEIADDLYNKVIMKYMEPGHELEGLQHAHTHDGSEPENHH